jgi:DNA polymerase III delta prime subunit
LTTTDQFPATLVISANSLALEKTVLQICQDLDNLPTPNNPDCFMINQNSGWGIDTIRKIGKFLSQKPFNHQNKIVIVTNAENLLTEAQNALLKTLEEPGLNNYIILTAPNSSLLLPTIVSRTHVIKVNGNATTPESDLLKISGNTQQDLLSSEKISQNKTEVQNILEQQILLQKQQLTRNPSLNQAENINKIIKAVSMIRHNVDPKSALDYYFLS